MTTHADIDCCANRRAPLSDTHAALLNQRHEKSAQDLAEGYLALAAELCTAFVGNCFPFERHLIKTAEPNAHDISRRDPRGACGIYPMVYLPRPASSDDSLCLESWPPRQAGRR
jgi:hypothetical protein